MEMIRRRQIIALIALLVLPLPLTAFELPKADAVFGCTKHARGQIGPIAVLRSDPVGQSRGCLARPVITHDLAPLTGWRWALEMGPRGLELNVKSTLIMPQNIGCRANAPALFNLGTAEFSRLFHDGRLEYDPAKPSGLRTPLSEDMVAGFRSPLAAQAMFPVLSADEMAGHYSENDISQAVRLGRITGRGWRMADHCKTGWLANLNTARCSS